MKVMYFSKKQRQVRILYTIGIYILEFLLKILANFNPKLKLGVDGRAQTFDLLSKVISQEDNTLWFHCASLGEYEQGLPVFKELRQRYQNHTIILTFFSPSGYLIRKNTEVADVVAYLPMDTRANAKRFFELVRPELTVFVKYDIWPNYLLELQSLHLKAILISAVFRPNQSYFKWYGGLMRKALASFQQIFVQNIASKELLERKHFTNVTVAGDTRFDRVSHQLEQDNHLSFAEEFKGDSLCIVIGSSWPEDEAVLVPFINSYQSKNIKYIIAPHNIKPSQIEQLKQNLKVDMVMFSEKEGKNLSDYKVLIVDTIGLLTKIYRYADIAYVGGAIGTTGLHNILEPAVFGVPIIIGNNHKKFPEAQAMMDNAGVVSIVDSHQFETTLRVFIEDDQKRLEFGDRNRRFVEQHTGAVDTIIEYTHL